MTTPTHNQQISPFSPSPQPWTLPRSDQANELYDVLRRSDPRAVREAVVMLYGDKRDVAVAHAMDDMIELAWLGDGWLANHSVEELCGYVDTFHGLAAYVQGVADEINEFTEQL